MSFQAYLETIERKSGLTPAALRALADAQGWTQAGTLKPATKASEVVHYLKTHHDLGHGHAMAVFALLKGTKREGDA